MVREPRLLGKEEQQEETRYVRKLERDWYPEQVERVVDPDSETSSLCCACRYSIVK